MENNKNPFKLKISLNVLNHLGIKLYSNVPAVLSEIIANAWDADAELVTVDTSIEDTIVIQDTGHGMSFDDINDKYLNIGYNRRTSGGAKTPKYDRDVMGRKGIGKLSLFSIADEITIETLKEGEANAFFLDAKEIERKLVEEEEGEGEVEELLLPKIDTDLSVEGTKITLKKLKKNINSLTNESLKKRVARRFGILGVEHDFIVKINNDEVLITDRDYFHKIEYLWYLGNKSEKYKDYCDPSKLKFSEKRDNEITVEGINKELFGWIGTVTSSGDLKDNTVNLNKVVITVRGKVAQEDIMEDFSEAGIFSKYIIGEINADFLDEDDKDDIATTSRQDIKKEDPRYIALKLYVQEQIKHIQSTWTALRNEEGLEKAKQYKVIDDWYDELGSDDKKKAKKLFGKINELKLDNEEDRKIFFRHGILAFETLKYKENLDLLDTIDVDNLENFTKVFSEHNDIEASMYYQITKSRIEIIEKLMGYVDDNELEEIVQRHLYENLWLLDPSWDRATENPIIEESVKTAFEALDLKLDQEIKDGRVDIRYKKTAGKHIIIELKRPGRKVSTVELILQIEKYRDKLQDILRATNVHEPIEVICLVGENLTDHTNPEKIESSRKMLDAINARVVMYQELIHNSYDMYSEYIEKNKEAGKVFSILEELDNS
jgi:hypothetical protein